jgi:outer membrane receptor for ferric coprogen and ferric-rhodotorulic acid
MNTYPQGRYLARFAALLLSGSLVFAQAIDEKATAKDDTTKQATQPVTVSATTAGSTTADNDVVTLTPFSVATDRDVGFVAASSFAGGRMATDLKDTPIAYSVLTKEFLETLALVDTEKAMDWAVNSSQSRDDGADRIYNYDGGTRTRVRGVLPKVMRNFFEFGRFGDTYNQDRIDYARGANALLIGNGGLGGALIMLTKQAQFGKPFAVLGFTMSDQGARRATIDFNQPAGDKLAFRGNLLLQDSDSWRDRVFDKRTGIYLTGSYRPTGKTQIRVDYEKFRQKELAALTHFNDYVSGWDGTTVFTAPTAALANSNALGVARYGTTNIMIPALGASTVMNWANTWRTMGGAESSVTPVNGVLSINPSTGAAGSYMIDIENEPANRFTIATAKSGFTVPGREDIAAPDTPTFKQYLDNLSVFIDQQLGENFFLQASYSGTTGGRDVNFLTGRLGNLYIDVNQKLPNGQANPYYLQPYVESPTRDDTGTGEDQLDEYRFAAAWTKDNTRFGSFKVNAIAGHTVRHTTNRTYTQVMMRNSNIRERPFLDTFGYRYYLNEPNKSYVTPGEVTYVDPITGTTNTYKVQRILDLNYADANNREAERTFDYLQAAAFAKLFKDRVTVLAGVRRDKFELQSWNMRTNPRTSYPADWDGTTYYTNPSAPADYFKLTSSQQNLYNPPDISQEVTTLTYGSVVHALPWVSGFYNYAETYDTSRSVQDINGRLVEPLLSDGWDAGIRFNFLDGRINASLATYGTTQNHTILTGPGFFQAILESNVMGDLSANGRNQRGLEALPLSYFDFQDSKARGEEFEIVANLTKNWRLTYNLAFPETLSSNRFNQTWAYLNANEATLRQIVLDTGATIDANGTASTTVSPTVSPDVNTAVSNWNSMQTWKKSNDPAIEVVNSNYKFTTNLYTDYRFSSGPVSGLRIGAGVQYRSKIQIGNRANDTIVNPANPLTAIDDPNVDGNTPVYMDPWYLVSLTAGYDIKLKHGRNIGLNLNVSNLLDEDRPIYFGASTRPRNGDITQPSRVTGGGPLYYLEPRTITLSARLTF